MNNLKQLNSLENSKLFNNKLKRIILDIVPNLKDYDYYSFYSIQDGIEIVDDIKDIHYLFRIRGKNMEFKQLKYIGLSMSVKKLVLYKYISLFSVFKFYFGKGMINE